MAGIDVSQPAFPLLAWPTPWVARVARGGNVLSVAPGLIGSLPGDALRLHGTVTPRAPEVDAAWPGGQNS